MFKKNALLLSTLLILSLFPLVSLAVEPVSKKNSIISSSNKQKISLLKEQLTDDPQSVELKKNLAKQYVKMNKSQKAISLLRPYTHQLDRKGFLILAKAYHLEKRYAEEIKILNLLLLKKSKAHVTYTLLGDAFLEKKDLDNAIVNYRSAIKNKPRYRKAYDKLLDAFELMTKKNSRFRYEQRIILSDMIKIFGHRPKIYNRFCRLFSEDGFLKESVKYCKTAIKKDPQHPDNHVHLGMALLDLGQINKGHKYIFTAAKKFSQSSFSQNIAGKKAFTQNDYPAAKRYYSSCIDINPKQDLCQIGLAESAYELQNYQLSIKSYTAACQLNRKYIQKFRVAASKLRSTARQKWHIKFQEALETCR